jgi:1-acyl-sn-glycerol-3-phosphate acyltransferase
MPPTPLASRLQLPDTPLLTAPAELRRLAAGRDRDVLERGLDALFPRVVPFREVPVRPAMVNTVFLLVTPVTTVTNPQLEDSPEQHEIHLVSCSRLMVARNALDHAATRRSVRTVSTPLLWRVLMAVDRGFVALTGRLEVTGDIPAELRDGPLLLASNHIGNLDPFILIAACRKVGVSPRFLLAGGLLDAPVVGPALRACGHLRVDRASATVGEAFHRTVDALRRGGDPIAVYPEGRISLDPGLWPERGKTGAARIALGGDVPVVPISQWGAHEAVHWGSLRVAGWADFKPYLTSWLRSVRRRPVFKVHFGKPVDLSGLRDGRPGDARRAHERIMRGITEGLAPLRIDESETPRFVDPTRPTTGSSPWKPVG